MLSFNQHHASGVNFDYSSGNVNNQQWYTAQPYFNKPGFSGVTQFNNTENPPVPYQVSTYYQAPNQCTNWSPSQSFQSFASLSSQHVRPNPNYAQTNQMLMAQTSWHPTSNACVQPKTINTSARKHQACISLVPSSSGGFKTIIKRKRKRTMFTTEQVDVLESVFQTKPYVSREDRQILVKQLQLTDTSVKVWFQNRRLRGKREEIEAAEDNIFEKGYSSQNSPHYLSQLDYIESELLQKVDESGYLPLDDNTIQMIVDVIDSALTTNLDIEALSNSSDNVTYVTDSPICVSDSSSCATDSSSSVIDSSGCSVGSKIGCDSYETDVPSISNEVEIETSASSDGENCPETVPIYEPISPAELNNPDEPITFWKPTSNNSLQTLCDLHFC